MTEADLLTPVVVDNGSHTIKCSLAPYEEDQDGRGYSMKPDFIVPSVVGYASSTSTSTNSNSDNVCLVGNDAIERFRAFESESAPESSLMIKHPFGYGGVIDDWSSMEHLWSDIFLNKLKIQPKEHPLVMSLSPFNPESNHDKLCEVLFESFEFPTIYCDNPSKFALLSALDTHLTGLVLEMGFELCYATSYFSGCPLQHEIAYIGGRDVSAYLERIMVDDPQYAPLFDKYKVGSFDAINVIRAIKEKYCHFSANFEKQVCADYKHTREYALPNGQQLTVGNVLFRAPHIFVQPSLIGGLNDQPNMIDLIYNTVQKSCIDYRRELYSHIILSGGTAMIRNSSAKIKQQLDRLTPDSIKVSWKRTLGGSRYNSWHGGAMFATLRNSNILDVFITKHDYEEHGARIIGQKWQLQQFQLDQSVVDSKTNINIHNKHTNCYYYYCDHDRHSRQKKPTNKNNNNNSNNSISININTGNDNADESKCEAHVGAHADGTNEGELDRDQLIFKRYLFGVLKNAKKYYQSFVENEFNDLEILVEFGGDEDEENQSIQEFVDNCGMKRIQAKLFMRKLKTLHRKNERFQQWLQSIVMFDRYYERFAKSGIVTITIMEDEFECISDFIEFLGGAKHEKNGILIWDQMPKNKSITQISI